MERILGLQSEISAHHFYEGMLPFGDAINAYQELGFEITGIFPLSREFDQLRVIEFDFVFMRAVESLRVERPGVESNQPKRRGDRT